MPDERCILHVDMNAFYASVEASQNPKLRHVPMAVGGDERRRHGIILAKNALAQAYGIRTGETLRTARQKCPELRIVPPHYERYLHYANVSREIYRSYTSRVEPYGLDESWLDVTGLDARRIIRSLHQEIPAELGVTVSIGVAWCKVMAKLASDLRKPNAVTVLSRRTLKTRIWPLPIENLLFVGPANKQKLNDLGIRYIGDLAQVSPAFIERRFGKPGLMLRDYANGLDDSEVAVFSTKIPPKTIGNSVTTPHDLKGDADIKVLLYALCEKVSFRLREAGLRAGGVHISFRDKNLTHYDYYTAVNTRILSAQQLAESALQLLRERHPAYSALSIRSLGIRAVHLSPFDSRQTSYLSDVHREERLLRLESSIFDMRMRYGTDSVKRAFLLDNRSASLMRDIRPDLSFLPWGL